MGKRSSNEERRSGSRRAVMREKEKQEQVRRVNANLPQNRMNSQTEYKLLIHPGSGP